MGCRSCCLAVVFLAVLYASILFCIFFITGLMLQPAPISKNYQCGVVADNKAKQHGPHRWILNGTAISPEKYPWVVSIWDIYGFKACSASVVAPRFVLTAAHCFTKAVKTEYGGGNDGVEIAYYPGYVLLNSSVIPKILNRNDLPPSSKVIAVKTWNMPDSLRSVGNHAVGDMLLAELVEEIPFGPDGTGFQPICLSEDFIDEQGKAVVAVGYGTFKEGEKRLLREGQTQLISSERCQHCAGCYQKGVSAELELCTIGLTSPSPGNASCTIKPNLTCSANASPYFGDSGGPLQTPVGADRRWVQVGVVSWGVYSELEVLQPGTSAPAVYARVSAFCEWLHEASGGEVKCKRGIHQEE